MAAARAASASGGGARPALSSAGPAGRPRGRTSVIRAWRGLASGSQRAGSEDWAEPQRQVHGERGAAAPAAGVEPSPLRVPRLQEPPLLTLGQHSASAPDSVPQAPLECWRASRYTPRDRCLYPPTQPPTSPSRLSSNPGLPAPLNLPADPPSGLRTAGRRLLSSKSEDGLCLALSADVAPTPPA